MKIKIESVEIVGNKKQKKNKKDRKNPKDNPKVPQKSLKVGSGEGVAGKTAKVKKESSKKDRQAKRAIVGVPTNKNEKLVDLGYMRRHNFLSVTTPMLHKIYRMTRVDERSNKYETDRDPHHVSAIMKLVLSIMQSNELSYDWSTILWNITQQSGILPEGCSVTFSRVFERKDNEMAKKTISRRRKLSILSSGSPENASRQSVAASHDFSLIDAINSGDSVIAFGAEAIVTAPTEQILEVAVDALKNYLTANDETRGMHYELDVNRQMNPFVTHGPNDSSGNKDVYVDMKSIDAAQSALFVDSGGDRTLGAEYVGISVGKLIRSHAAYSFKKNTSLYVGNDAVNKTSTLAGVIDEPSQTYLSKVASRAYLLSGKKVTHIVADDPKFVQYLMSMPIYDSRKKAADVSKGLLNMMEAIDDGSLNGHPERILSRFPMHINNIITLLGQFRDVQKVSITDDFANVARDILIDFFVINKYWSYDARRDLKDIRLVGVQHNQFKTLSDFGQYVAQRKRSSRDSDPDVVSALNELDTIVNRTILSTIPALDTTTDDSIDDLVQAQYCVVDLTGMGAGAVGDVSNPSMNVMMISYLNLLLPSMENGDLIVIHGISKMSAIAKVIKDIIGASALNLDVVYTEKNQNAAMRMISATSDTIEIEDEVTHRIKKTTRAMNLDFVVVDLYNNRSDKLVEAFGMDGDWVGVLRDQTSSFFIRTETGLDYIYLDKIL